MLECGHAPTDALVAVTSCQPQQPFMCILGCGFQIRGFSAFPSWLVRTAVLASFLRYAKNAVLFPKFCQFALCQWIPVYCVINV